MSEHRELRAKAGVFGTPKEEFDIATGYWKKWQRVEAENEALRERVQQMEEALQTITDIADSKEAVLMTGSELAAKITSIAYPALKAREPSETSEKSNRLED